jgi:hypothetical protein
VFSALLNKSIDFCPLTHDSRHQTAGKFLCFCAAFEMTKKEFHGGNRSIAGYLDLV